MYTNYPAYSSDGYGERDDIALEQDRQWENRPPAGYTRWEDYEASQESKRFPFKKLDSCEEQFIATILSLIQESLDQRQASISLWADQFPNADAVDRIIEAISIQEGLCIEWENTALPGSDKVDLIFSWE